MFLDKIKDFFAKKIVKKSLSNVKHIDSNNYIKRVGIVFDETNFYDKDKLIKELVFNGIKEENIQFLCFKNQIKKSEIFDYPVFSHSDISWTATINNKTVNNFINDNFDLLISYYDIEKAALLLTTSQSKALFKVGFSNIDKRLNHFMIDTSTMNYKVFTDELFKYLKILNKL